MVWAGLRSYDECERNGTVLHCIGLRSVEEELLLTSELEEVVLPSEYLLSGGVRTSKGTEVRSGKLIFGNLGVVGSLA